MTQASKPVEHTVAAIAALDLDPIKLKLMDPEEGPGWSREYAERMEVAYKRFLTLLAKFPEETIAPTKDVDKFWHGHILDTLKYAADCEHAFGYFLHHFPYFGMRGEQDAANLRAAADRMHEIYEREFGEALPNGAGFCMAAKSASAFCMSAKPESAFCMASKPTNAFCMASTTSLKQAAGFCMATKPDSAFCMAAKPANAFCMATRPTLKQTNSFCMAAKPS